VVQSQPYDLVAVSMPPEMYDVDISEEEAGIKNEGQTGRLTLFAEDVSTARIRQEWTRLTSV
jgi:hypothetical protein